jgi:hypothetical protein
MAIATVLTTNLYNGLNTHVWTGWVFFAIFLGVVLVWIYTVRHRFMHVFLTHAHVFAGYIFYYIPRLDYY